MNYLKVQLRISQTLFHMRNDVDSVIFFIGGDTLLIPMVTARVIRKEASILVGGSSIKTLESKGDPLQRGLKALRFATCMLAGRIIVYSPLIIRDYSLERWHDKIRIAHEHFLDFTLFNVINNYRSRETIIGYVGRFSEEKGITPLIHAASAVVDQYPDVKFILIGDGSLRKEIEQYITDNGLENFVILLGWVDHSSLSPLLNRMKLLVIPSDTEGLPNTMLEAMACGTPVLATPVGAIPDVIIDGKTGFIMENNSPECIAESVSRSLNSPDLERISENGRRFVEENFTFESTVAQWKQVLERTIG